MKNLVRCLTLLSLFFLPVKMLAAGPDVSFYGVIKGQSFVQDNPVAPALKEHGHDSNGQDSGALFFNVFVELTASNVVQNASLTIPGVAVTNLLLSQNGMTKRIEAKFESKVELDTQFPNGTYTLIMVGNNDGTKTVNLSLTGDTYPSVPRISNYSEAQTVSGPSFNLTWDAFTGGTASDFVEVTVEEQTQFGSTNVYRSPDFGTAGALNGMSTLVLVTNLSPGKVYSARLMIAKGVVDNTSYGSGVTGIAAYTKETEFTIRTTGSVTDTMPPNYLGSTPQYGSTNVALHSVIAFHFNEPMQTSASPSITWTNVTGANFSYSWSGNKTTLFCKYGTSLPAGTVVGWHLDKTGFHDVAGNELQFDPMRPNADGFFTTSGNTAPSLDVESIVLVKGRGAFTTNGPPIDSGMFQFGLESGLRGHNTVTNGILSIPGGGTLDLHPDDHDGDNVKLKMEYASQADMDRFFPNGTYTVSLNGARDGTKNVNISITGDEYPSFPTIANFSSTQSVNPSNSFVLSWSGFATGTASDIIEVEIRNQYGQEVYYSPEDSLTGTATQVNIPVNTLAPGRTYEATVRFIKIKHFEPSASTYAGVMAVSVYVSETEFELRTTGQVIQPRFSILPASGGSFQARLTGEKGVPYTIEATQDFVTWNFVSSENAWSNINGLEATIDFTDGNSWNLPRRFYRAKEGNSDYNQGSGSFVSLEGTVRNANTPSILVQGAIVSTQLDGQSTITDSSGHFFLQTTTPANYSTTPYTVTVTASGYQTYIVTTSWGDHPTGLFIDLVPQ